MTAVDDASDTEAVALKKGPKFTCAITGKARPKRDLVRLDHLRPTLAGRIRADHPDLADEALISRGVLAWYRTRYVEELLRTEHGELTELDRQVAESLAKHETLAEDTDEEFEEHRTIGERLSDHLASFGGSWTFIILFGCVLFAWM